MTNNNPPIIWVKDSNDFTRLAESWLKCEYLAIDTEFERRTTYYPILALVQVFDGRNTYLIDPLSVECPQAFRDICSDRNIVKIMHSAREDLEVFFYSWGCRLNNLFDTQIAYAFISGELSKGYAALVETLCHQTLDKQQTQSDWIKRPLSAKQIDYAAKDVIYLPAIYQQLSETLQNKLYKGFVEQESNELCGVATRQPDYSIDYRSAKDVWKLNSQQLSLFKRLYQWREETAIKDDRTKNHILKDPELVQVAMLQPSSKTALQKVDNFHPRSMRLYAQAILDVVNKPLDSEELLEMSSDELPKVIVNSRDVDGFKELSNEMQQAIKSEAEVLGFSAGLLASKRMINKMAVAQLTGEVFPEIYQGWRGAILKPLFEPIFTQLTD